MRIFPAPTVFQLDKMGETATASLPVIVRATAAVTSMVTVLPDPVVVTPVPPTISKMFPTGMAKPVSQSNWVGMTGIDPVTLIKPDCEINPSLS